MIILRGEHSRVGGEGPGTLVEVDIESGEAKNHKASQSQCCDDARACEP